MLASLLLSDIFILIDSDSFCHVLHQAKWQKPGDRNSSMQASLEKLTDRVERSAAGLGRRYRARQLHALRVGIRRIRTFLKHSGGPRARRLRRTWGAFAAVTGDARDWDVFHVTERALLTPDDFRAFQRLYRKRLRDSHRAVRSMVVSAHWRRHIEEWRAYLERSAKHPAPSDRQPRSLETALAKAGSALATAADANDDRAWHRFRIAVKETRYIAEAAGSTAARTQQVIATCKSLQATLGAWHDTVVQLQLLDELEPDPVHARLRTLIRRRKTQSLSQTRAILSTQSIFVPA
jgi:CHAD domain-containing protein